MQPTPHTTVTNDPPASVIDPATMEKAWLAGLPLYLGLAVTAFVCVLLALRVVGLAS